ncbi:hypothetical protein SCLCIDRAFT_1213241 [Scleroderma citrinum Foug A]|uniref:Uncharacterized protein n=1 Tax=Scleroderma citrinum Foug A TaxID=1036808 RepID=A0A0C3E7J2_9AGAM|nr:hypothetical protein SCLCIDRAFT_1213241 [Scleroderma citrinum Foug A]
MNKRGAWNGRVWPYGRALNVLSSGFEGTRRSRVRTTRSSAAISPISLKIRELFLIID